MRQQIFHTILLCLCHMSPVVQKEQTIPGMYISEKSVSCHEYGSLTYQSDTQGPFLTPVRNHFCERDRDYNVM